MSSIGGFSKNELRHIASRSENEDIAMKAFKMGMNNGFTLEDLNIIYNGTRYQKVADLAKAEKEAQDKINNTIAIVGELMPASLAREQSKVVSLSNTLQIIQILTKEAINNNRTHFYFNCELNPTELVTLEGKGYNVCLSSEGYRISW